MTNAPTLTETLAVQPEQLTGLTPVEVDRYNLVLSDEFGRVDEAIDKACERLYGALLLSKESVRRGRGWSQVWPITFAEAEKRAREHLETGYEPDQRERLRHGLTRDGSYAEQLRAAVEKLDALRAERKSLADGPAAVLDGEFRQRGGWTRMHLCTTDGGHIHTGRQCPSIGPRTPLVWLPEVSGMDWRDAYRLIVKDMTAGTEAIMCSKKTCFPDAPTEWTQRQAPDTECPGSRQYAKLMAPGMIRRVHRWAEFHECGKKDVGVTPNGNLRKHDRPQGGEEAAPAAPVPQSPAADAPRGDELVVIERKPLEAAGATGEKPAPAEETPAPAGKPGKAPTTAGVAKFLRAAGFQLSRHVESSTGPVGSGAHVRKLTHGRVLVSWREGTDDFLRRMNSAGVADVRDVPAHPEAESRAQAYAEALAPRYRVDRNGHMLYLYAREELPARPPGIPRAAAVRKALTAAGVSSSGWGAVDQPDSTRVAVTDDAALDAVREALKAEGWQFGQSENWQHYVLTITGSAPDRPARLRKLRAERERRTTDLAGRAAVAKVEEGIRQERAAQENGRAPMPADIPEADREPVPYAYDGKGHRWEQGQRAEFRTSDGFLMAGQITALGEENGEKAATVLVDTRRVAPASRAPRGMTNTPGESRPVNPPREWRRPLDQLMRA